MPCAKVHSRIPSPLRYFSTRAASSCGTVWTWSDGWREALTDDLDKVTCKRCIYLLTRWGYIVERQLFLPGMSTIIPVKET